MAVHLWESGSALRPVAEFTQGAMTYNTNAGDFSGVTAELSVCGDAGWDVGYGEDCEHKIGVHARQCDASACVRRARSRCAAEAPTSSTR